MSGDGQALLLENAQSGVFISPRPSSLFHRLRLVPHYLGFQFGIHKIYLTTIREVFWFLVYVGVLVAIIKPAPDLTAQQLAAATGILCNLHLALALVVSPRAVCAWNIVLGIALPV
jgi:hypothetical protein